MEQEQPAPSEWLTARELADRWHVGYETIRRRLICGDIPSLQIGSLRRISIKVVEKMESAACDGMAQRDVIRETVKAVRSVKRSLRSEVPEKDFFPEL